MKKKGIIIGVVAVIVVISIILIIALSGGGLSGTWKLILNDGSIMTYTFSGNSFTATAAGSGVPAWFVNGKGTYSITGDKIEFKYDDSFIQVLSFSQTENTIEVNRWFFTRQK
ncbi:MAG: hypothetical protein FWD48_09275 [Oscillospiraceae bacterium]|nr:hypothetical protein [Oscillospiraceae bacterium]